MFYHLVLQRPNRANPEYMVITEDMASKIREKLKEDKQVILVDDNEGNMIRLETSHYSRITLEKVEANPSPDYHSDLDDMT